ncbi:hypothetical protein WJX72_005230 [[Myrmecia] bisecta]|uniref:Striatin N-terminal domain-containing protein n=1 Tax=[Myrmecia] bisecta TaxID=41462 RepID=A0AAW1P8F1_9CHLO
MARAPLERLSIPSVCYFLQEEWRAQEAAKQQWLRERKTLLTRVSQLDMLAHQQEGVITMLEKRILMLQAALARERASQAILASATASPGDSLVSHALSDRVSDSGGETSPLSSDGNNSGRTSPTGRHILCPAVDSPERQRGLVQRSLVFGTADGLPTQAPEQLATPVPKRIAGVQSLPLASGATVAASASPSSTRAAAIKNKAMTKARRLYQLEKEELAADVVALVDSLIERQLQEPEAAARDMQSADAQDQAGGAAELAAPPSCPWLEVFVSLGGAQPACDNDCTAEGCTSPLEAPTTVFEYDRSCATEAELPTSTRCADIEDDIELRIERAFGEEACADEEGTASKEEARTPPRKAPPTSPNKPLSPAQKLFQTIQAGRSISAQR